MWEDLGQYLCKINPDLADKSISELVAADPVATSNFIDNKLKVFLEFITSDENPIREGDPLLLQAGVPRQWVATFSFPNMG